MKEDLAKTYEYNEDKWLFWSRNRTIDSEMQEYKKTKTVIATKKKKIVTRSNAEQNQLILRGKHSGLLSGVLLAQHTTSL